MFFASFRCFCFTLILSAASACPSLLQTDHADVYISDCGLASSSRALLPVKHASHRVLSFQCSTSSLWFFTCSSFFIPPACRNIHYLCLGSTRLKCYTTAGLGGQNSSIGMVNIGYIPRDGTSILGANARLFSFLGSASGATKY